MRAPVSLAAFAVVTACSIGPGKPYPSEEPTGSDVRTEAPAEAKPAADVAQYFDRQVALAPLIAGFPYGQFDMSLEDGELFYLEKRDQYLLKRLPLGEGDIPALDLGAGAKVLGQDWSKRSLGGIQRPKGSDTLWVMADAKNAERFNLYTLEPGAQGLTQVTDDDYIYGWGFNETGTKLAYLPRTGTKAPFKSCLVLMDPKTREREEVVCDSPELSFSWSSLRFSPDDKEIYFHAKIGQQRDRGQLVKVDLTKKRRKVEILTDAKVKRGGVSLLHGWVDGKTLLFRSNDDGFSNLYSYSRRTRKIKQLTRFKEGMSSAHLTDDGVIGSYGTPAGSTLVLIDPKTGKVLDEKKFQGTVRVGTAHGSRALMTQRAPDIVYEIQQVSTAGAKLGVRPIMQLDPEIAAGVVHCKAEAVKIPTFDRELHAFLLRPREPQTDPRAKLGMIRSFYGGSNSYTRYDHALCAAGITVLSPAVRGSGGFGKAFSELNNRDLGGDEIVDLFYAARWLEARENLPASRIGVYGRSHGGYATMRAMTFVPGTNGRNETYPFGFGVAESGFSDIKAFYDATNIPDWVVLESGDPNVPADLAKMNDRSPINHVDRLAAPILLVHGENDWRVPVQGSRDFVERARAQGKAVTYEEFAGQGHHVEGLALQVKAYQARFDFLMEVAKAAPATATAPAPGN